MAYTERYVTSAAGGGGAGTSGDPWTLAEALSNAAAGDRVNVQSDAGYSISGGTISNAGTINSRIVFRGYNSSIGDLEGQGRNSDGSLNTTNFPVITVTATPFIPSNYSILQDLSITGAIAASVLNGVSPDYTASISCKFTNTASSTSARAAEGDTSSVFVNCDFECTQTTHGDVFTSDNFAIVVGCRFIGNTSGAFDWCSIRDGQVINSAFVNKGTSGSSNGFVLETANGKALVTNNTFYNFGNAISLPNGAQTTETVVFVNNHYTDCNNGINNLYSGTANQFIIEMSSRTRDNTTNRTGLGDSINVGEITTDTGGPSTDYIDAANGDLTLKTSAPAAPAVDAGTGL